jgi:hypothetical protein
MRWGDHLELSEEARAGDLGDFIYVANRFFDRAGAVARPPLQISELDKLCDDRRRGCRPLETDNTARRQHLVKRIAVWAAEKPS